jgi:hypothetical protein
MRISVARDWLGLYQKPAVRTVRAPNPMLHAQRLAQINSSLEAVQRDCSILWMDRVEPAVVTGFFERSPCIVEPAQAGFFAPAITER